MSEVVKTNDWRFANLEIVDCEVDVDSSDYPDFADAYITAAEWSDGTELDEAALDRLNQDSAFVYEEALKSFF